MSTRDGEKGGRDMVGFITERDLGQAEREFPGITRFFAALTRKPRTFLDLVSLFQHWGEATPRFRKAA
jgi:hypothetical protein